MKACLAELNRLSQGELEQIASGEVDAPECEVEGARLILVEIWRATVREASRLAEERM